MSLFKISMRMANGIEKMMIEFLWEGSVERNRDHLVKLKFVSQSRLNGGLAGANIVF